MQNYIPNALPEILSDILLAQGRILLNEFMTCKKEADASNLSRQIEQNIILALNQVDPEASVFGKYHGQLKADSFSSQEFIWLINAIDGVTNFIYGVPHFCLTLTAVIGGKLYAAAVYDPVRQELFMASVGEGASCNKTPIETSKQKNFHQSVVAIDFAPQQSDREKVYLLTCREVLRHCQAARHFGAIALDICWVACGRFDALLSLDCKALDVAASSLILTEANGCAVNFTSEGKNEYDIFSESLVCSNPYLHYSLLNFAKKGYRAALNAL